MFQKLLGNFDNNIEGLRDYVDLIQPMLDEYHQKEKEKHDGAFVPLAIASQIHTTEDDEKKRQLSKELDKIFDGSIEVEEVEADEEGPKRIGFKIDGDTSDLDAAFEFQIKSNQQRNLLYVNSLISLLSSAEWFYSQLLHFFYDQNPKAASIKKKTLTLDELKTFGSVEEAEKFLIDSKIEQILRSSFSDWIDTLKNEIGLGLGYLTGIKEELVEIYLRRNLFVHNGGVVNSIYLSKVDTKYSKGVNVGDQLTVDAKYLENAITKIHIVFSLFAFELWKKLEPNESKRAEFLINLGYEYLCKQKWESAKMPNYFLKQDAQMPTDLKTYGQLNCWLCDKKLGDEEKVQNKLAKIDFSDKSIVIQLALASLKEDKDAFFNLLPRVINSEELPINYLFEFPILSEMRKLDEFKEFVSENEIAQEYLKEAGLEDDYNLTQVSD